MVDKTLDKTIMEKILAEIPQQSPFRFVDGIEEVSENHIVGHYTYRHDEFFYQGHFPANPITPGVILIETMAQIGLVALALYSQIKRNDEKSFLTLFTECNVEFFAQVNPGDRVIVKSEKLFFRRNKLKAKATMMLENGALVAEGVLSGYGSEKL